MPRAILLCSLLSLCLALSLGFTATGYAQTSAGAGSPVQVVYLQDGTGLTTYDIDPNTLMASQVGGVFAMPLQVFTSLAPARNGKFLYIIGEDASNSQDLWVFPTDVDGVPHGPAVQIMQINALYDFSLDPGSNFAYGLAAILNSQSQVIYRIERFAVDPATGQLSPPTVVATYPFNGPCQSSVLAATPYLDGFSADGKTVYDNWYCNYPASTVATYYERSVDPQTGALSAEVEVFTWRDGSQGFDTVSFSHNHIIDYHSPNGTDTGNSLNVYPLIPNSTQPIIACTSTMLAICGSSSGEIVDPSGKFIFFVNSSFGDDVAEMDAANNRLIDTGESIPHEVAKFSPDGTIAYALNVSGSSYEIQIYGFNPVTGGLTTNGGDIAAPAMSDTFWPVLRQ